MGSCQLDLTALELGRTQDLVLCLHDPGKPTQDMGEIVMNVTLWPKSQEDKDQVSVTSWQVMIAWYFRSEGR